jgi:hypothetical protein
MYMCFKLLIDFILLALASTDCNQKQIVGPGFSAAYPLAVHQSKIIIDVILEY